jgi:RimJ/RimL family protein N-acetyltransferase
VGAPDETAADLPLGEPVDWSPAVAPPGEVLRGERVLLRPFDPPADAGPLHAATKDDPTLWAYLPIGPFATSEDLRAVITAEAEAEGYVFHAIEPLAEGGPLGQAAYMRIDPTHGTIEIGSIWFARRLQRTAAATEAIYLLARHAFDDLGYRRLEWKCNALNAASRRAAERYGFRFEGVFRRPRWSRAAAATPPGSRSPTTSGRRRAPPSRRGSTRRTSAPTACSCARSAT